MNFRKYREYHELPAYVREVVDSSNYAFSYALEFEEHYTLYTESGYSFETVIKQAEKTERNDVSSFFYYMWNAWSKEECERAFAESTCGWHHFWSKWIGICERNGHFGAVEEFFSELSEDHKDMLVRRAVETYNRGKRIWKQSI